MNQERGGRSTGRNSGDSEARRSRSPRFPSPSRPADSSGSLHLSIPSTPLTDAISTAQRQFNSDASEALANPTLHRITNGQLFQLVRQTVDVARGAIEGIGTRYRRWRENAERESRETRSSNAAEHPRAEYWSFLQASPLPLVITGLSATKGSVATKDSTESMIRKNTQTTRGAKTPPKMGYAKRTATWNKENF